MTTAGYPAPCDVCMMRGPCPHKTAGDNHQVHSSLQTLQDGLVETVARANGRTWDDYIPVPPEPGHDPDDRSDDARPRSRPHLRELLLSVSQLGTLPPVQPLVDGLIYRGTLAQLAGQPGSYKSFLSVAIACSVAAGVPFEDHEVPDGGPVVYVAAEGATGLRGRILAWCELAHVDPAELGQLHVLPVPVQLSKVVDIGEALDVVRETGAQLLVLDTRARCSIGLDENSSTEQGRAIDAVETLIRDTGCAVLVVHHASRTGTAGRGSNAWDGAVWSDLRVTGENLQATVACHKHKDVPAGCEHQFRLIPHTVAEQLMPGTDDAQRRTLAVVRVDGRPDAVGDGKSTRTVAEIVRACDGPEGLTRPQIITLAQERGVSRTQAYAAVKTLIGRGALLNISPTNTARYALATSYRPDDEGPG